MMMDLGLLMRNIGLSRKSSYPVKISFDEEREVRVKGGGADLEMKGEWSWAGSLIVVSAKLPALENGLGQDQDMETYKYFLKWDESKGKDLILDKMVVWRPFRKGDGAKRQSWMSSLILMKSRGSFRFHLHDLRSKLLSKVLTLFLHAS